MQDNGSTSPGQGMGGQNAAKTVPAGGMPGDQASAEMRRRADLNPGDELAPGMAGAGENYCLHCGGSGRLDGGRECGHCGGTGKVIESVAGGP